VAFKLHITSIFVGSKCKSYLFLIEIVQIRNITVRKNLQTIVLCALLDSNLRETPITYDSSVRSIIKVRENYPCNLRFS